MAKAMIDPEEVRAFATELDRFSAQLQSSMSALQSRFRRLGDSWHDQEHDKFAEPFEETMQTLARFIQAADHHVPYLRRKAQRAEDYLNQH